MGEKQSVPIGVGSIVLSQRVGRKRLTHKEEHGENEFPQQLACKMRGPEFHELLQLAGLKA